VRRWPPSLDVPARLEGPTFRNWRKGVMEPYRDTFAACLMRWVGMGPKAQDECALYWGSGLDGGRLSPARMAAWVMTHGLPGHDPQPPREALERLVGIRRPAPAVPTDGPYKASQFTTPRCK